MEGGGAELGNLLREDVLFVAGGGHPCIKETDGEGGVGVGLDGRAIGLAAEDLFAISFPGVDRFAGFVADTEGFGDVFCHSSCPDPKEVEAIRHLFLILVRMAVGDLSQLTHAPSLDSCGFPEDGFETEGGQVVFRPAAVRLMEDGGIEKGGVDMVEVYGLADGLEIPKLGRGHAVEIEEALRGGIGLRDRGASHGKGDDDGGDGFHDDTDSTDMVAGKWGIVPSAE